jgi:hypothetical protein
MRFFAHAGGMSTLGHRVGHAIRPHSVHADPLDDTDHHAPLAGHALV